MGAMAGFRALAAVGRSIEALLNRRFADEPLPADVQRPTAMLVRTEDFDRRNAPGATIIRPAVSLYCYRISVDHESRSPWAAVTASDNIPRLPLRLHFLVSAWDGSVQREMEWLGLTARILEAQSILTGDLLDPLTDWGPGECIQIVTDDLALDSMSEAFQALTTDYRLCLPYVARVVVVEGGAEPPAEPVATVGAGFVQPQGGGP
jgi:hypothetical protein